MNAMTVVVDLAKGSPRGRAGLSEGPAVLLAALQGLGPCRGFAPGGPAPQCTGGQLLHGAPVAARATVVVGMGVEGAPEFEQQRGGGQTLRTDNSMIRHAAVSLAWFVQQPARLWESLPGIRQECLPGAQTDKDVGWLNAPGPSAEHPADGPSVAWR